MNPHAREFVPAHILRKRQEEANRLSELTEQLTQVGLDETSKDKENGTSYNHESSKTDNNPLERAVSGEESSGAVYQERGRIQHSTNDTKANDSETDTGENLNIDLKYAEEVQSFNDCEDDGYLLRAGENLCEFNGEQFIIPGDDEEEPPLETGYDFGNDEDNEDEDVCNAFEEFLGNLPDH